MKTYDLIIIGGGSGGLTAASGAAQFGASVALIEKKSQLGGDCLHAGCVPSKAFITVGKEIHQARQAAEQHNLMISGEVSLARVNKRVHEAIDDIQIMDDVSRFEEMGVDVYLKEAVFTGPHTVKLGDGEELEGKRIVIATGSKAIIPPIDNIEALPYFTNETIFDAEELPGHIVCVGGGPVGVELAQVLARLGAKVTIVGSAPRLFPNEEEEIGMQVQNALLEELDFIPDTRVEALEKDDASGHTHAVLSSGEKIKADALLIAAGRRPNTDSLQLDKAGIDPAKDGSIPVKPTLQTKAPHIYAVGDVTGTYAFTHAAGMEGQIVVTNAVFGLRRKVSYSTLPWVFLQSRSCSGLA
ncbi:NAD(P)/FAD-dependent oxidoreductase [Sinobaca sp. H24]|uniref:dihydrolipoyl dehydrogenase family protein n=1 Tax=Sinobaca sp. H24 TaxID=2923376 RepID=UPI00207A6C52|nr:FAD-dependent oxidoreductase [Sinobaca sp. H24]